ncbi:MAG: inositol 2-dehydrogenase [Trueperaceae bacterium]|nr:MAG: inositol 2-dehydrogenase [Trueperaceae bacterium]
MALVGAGRMAQAHAATAAGIAQVDVVAVYDALREPAEHLAERIGARVALSLDELLGASDVEALLITTPTPTHADVICSGAEAGKAMFVEKPLADTLAAADRAVDAVDAASVACQVGFQRRYDPAYIEAKRRIESGEIGRIEGFRGVGRDPQPPALEFLLTSGGLFVDMGIHDLDSARFLVGEVATINAIGAATDPRLAEHGLFDMAVATMRFVNGALGTLEVGLRTAYGYDIRAEVLGQHGRIHIERDIQHHMLVYTSGGVTHDRPQSFAERFAEAYAAEIRSFVHAVRHDLPVTPDAHDARESLRLALAAQQALVTGREVVLVPTA